MAGLRYDLFIAHAGADLALGQQVRTALTAVGLTCFLDAEDLQPGDAWDDVLPEAQRRSRATLVLVSRRTQRAWYVREEIALAVQHARSSDHKVIPLILQGTKVIATLPYGLTRIEAAFLEREGWVRRVAAAMGHALPTAEQDRTLEALEEAIAGDPENADLRRRRADLRRQMTSGDGVAAGQLFADRYRLKTVLGRGGFGTVWRAYDVQKKKHRALKILHHDLDARRQDRFKRGVRKMADMDHPGIVRVIDGPDEHAGRTYVVLELVEGGDLSEALGQRRIGPAIVPALIEAIAAALAHAHARGAVHRDVKPANIVLTPDGRPKLTDFDLVRADDTDWHTRTSAVGSILFMAPEIMDGEDGTNACDQYGLAMTAISLLNGRPLPARTIRGNRLEKAVRSLPVSDATKAVLTKGIADEPEDRYPGVNEFAAALTAAMQQPEPKPADPIASTGAPTRPTAARPALIAIPGGTFQMGSPPGVGHSDERPQRRVTLSPFWMSATTVTQAQFEHVLQKTPSHFKGADRPVDSVHWGEALAFCNALSVSEGLEPAYERERLVPGRNGYRLPTEAEWEYACRAGTMTQWSHRGDVNRLKDVAWFGERSKGATHPVGQQQPNPWGLHDMHGNVWEWCHDRVGRYPEAPVQDPRGPASGGVRVVRGGSYWGDADDCRSAYRLWRHPGGRYQDLGFRLVRPAPSSS